MKMLAVALAALSALATPARAQTRLFSDNTPIAISISAPMTTLIHRAIRSTDPFPGSLTLEGEANAFPLQISARGMSRRVGGICSFPPIKLDFQTPTLAGTLLEGQGGLKLVDPCQPGQSYEQLVVLEYLAYRLYNVITPVSYRVRAVRVTFHDSDGHRGDDTHFGYLIEDVHDVAHRNHLHELHLGSNGLSAAQLDGTAASREALFEYMISNLDWDPLSAQQGGTCCHNSKLLALDANAPSAAAPVPYDFDYSGLVNAPYAVPPERLPVYNVRTRYFRGYCRFNPELAGVISEYQAHKADLFAVIDNEPALIESRKRDAHAYLQQFFDILDNPAAVQSNLSGHCRAGH